MRIVIFLIALTASLSAARAETAVDLELCLASDGSGSIADDEFAFQRQGFAAAIASDAVAAAVQSGFHKLIAIAYMEWGGPNSMEPIVDWTPIGDRDAAMGFGARLIAAPRLAHGYNSISEAIDFCRNWMAGNAYKGSRMVIDVSGDAGQRGGRPLAFTRGLALEAGITINALALNFRGGGLSGPYGQPLIQHFREEVIGGFGAFAIAVEEQTAFVDALKRKLVLEIAGKVRESEYSRLKFLD